MLGWRKTSIETYFLCYYCYSTVLRGKIWQELEPEPKLWTKVEPEPESEPKINNFVSATLGNNISSESFWNDDAADSLSFTARDADAQNSSKGGLHQCGISGSGQIRTFMTRFRVFFPDSPQESGPYFYKCAERQEFNYFSWNRLWKINYFSWNRLWK